MLTFLAFILAIAAGIALGHHAIRLVRRRQGLSPAPPAAHQPKARMLDPTRETILRDASAQGLTIAATVALLEQRGYPLSGGTVRRYMERLGLKWGEPSRKRAKAAREALHRDDGPQAVLPLEGLVERPPAPPVKAAVHVHWDELCQECGYEENDHAYGDRGPLSMDVCGRFTPKGGG